LKPIIAKAGRPQRPERPERPERPATLPGFEQLQRFWEPDTQRWTVKILPGEYYVTKNDEAITTVLGSCVSACIRDPVAKLGGMNHFMLPVDASARDGTRSEPMIGLATRYGSHAMETLINDMLKLGATRDRLEIKLFGGGRVLTSMTDIGARNITFVHDYLELEGLPIAAEDLGGDQPRKIVYFPTPGRVRMRKLRPIENRSIADRELLYMDSLRNTETGGDIELFT
jgi:chemotaxis protein CheD